MSLESFHDLNSLDQRISEMFDFLDSDQSESLSKDELNAGLRRLRCNPPIALGEDDWEYLVVRAELCNGMGELDKHNFTVMMKEQLKQHMLNRLVTAMAVADPVQASMISVLKLLLSQTPAVGADFSVLPGPATAAGRESPSQYPKKTHRHASGTPAHSFALRLNGSADVVVVNGDDGKTLQLNEESLLGNGSKQRPAAARAGLSNVQEDEKALERVCQELHDLRRRWELEQDQERERMTEWLEIDREREREKQAAWLADMWREQIRSQEREMARVREEERRAAWALMERQQQDFFGKQQRVMETFLSMLAPAVGAAHDARPRAEDKELQGATLPHGPHPTRPEQASLLPLVSPYPADLALDPREGEQGTAPALAV